MIQQMLAILSTTKNQIANIYWIVTEKALATHSSALAWKNPMDGGAWPAVHGVAKSRTQLTTSLSLLTFMHWRRKWQPTPVFLSGESQGWKAWQGAVYGVAQSRTQLTRLRRSRSIGLSYLYRYKRFMFSLFSTCHLLILLSFK